MVIATKPQASTETLISSGCDFRCNKTGEPLIVFTNTDNGHQWVCHLSCLKEQIEILEEVEP
jgi:hypothetical protein